MNPINSASEVHDEIFQTFNGLLAVVLYNSLHSDLSDFIKKSYQDLHFSSGMDLLLFLCETDLPRIEADEDDPPSATFVTALSSGMSSTRKARVIDTLRRSFGIRSTKLPCLVFFSGPEARTSYLLPLGRDKARYERRFMAVCDAAHAVVEEAPPPRYDASPGAFVEWRENAIIRLAPRLNLERSLQAAANLPFIQLVTMAMKGFHGG